WGNDHRPLGPKILTGSYPKVLPASTTKSADGVEGAVSGRDEWCADVWSEPTIDHAAWGEPTPPAWGRVLRGGTSLKKVVPSAVDRANGDPYTYANELASIRLVRADNRAIPPDPPSAPAHKRATLEARRFETHVARPALEKLKSSPIAR